MDSTEEESMTGVISLVVAEFLQPLENFSRVNQINVNNVKASAKILLKVIRNALQEENSSDDVYRKIRLKNRTIQQKILKVPGAVDVLTVAGFLYCELEENGKLDKYLVFEANTNNVGLGNLVSSILQEELEKLQRRMDIQNVTMASTIPRSRKVEEGDNQFLSEEERKKRSIKYIKAKKMKLAEKERVLKRWDEDNETRNNFVKRKDATLNNNNNDSDSGMTVDDTIRNVAINDNRSESKSLQSIRSTAAKSWQMNQQQLNRDGDHDIISTTNGTTNYKLETRKDMVSVPPKESNKDDQEDSTLSLQHPTGSNHKDDEDMSLKSAPVPPFTQDQLSTTTTSNDVTDKMTSVQLLPSWEDCTRYIPRCGPANGIRDTSTFYTNKSPLMSSSSSSKYFRRLFTEFDELKLSLPFNKQCSAWLRFDEETPQYIRALLTAPLPGPSPYSGGLFTFDIYVPDTYPLIPPKVKLLNTGGGTVTFGPNLYADGKVCLSLLGTWDGPKWNPENSSLYQVLVSIQSLMLGVEHPYFLEPGYGGWEAQVKEGDFASVGKTLAGDVVREELTLPAKVWLYEDKIRLGNIRYAMLEPLKITSKRERNADGNGNDINHKGATTSPAPSYLSPFKDIIDAHFYHNGEEILIAVTAWLNHTRPGKEYPNNILKAMKELFPKLESHIRELSPPTLRDKTAPVAEAQVAIGYLFSKDSESAAGKIDQPEKDEDEEGSKNLQLKLLRDEMQKAAQSMNFILAGQLQKEIKDIEEAVDLNRKMEKAASEGDYILAGKYQVTLKSIEQQASNIPKPSTYSTNHDSDDEIGVADSYDSDSDEDDENPHNGFHDISNHGWGPGQPLNAILRATKGEKQSRKRTKKTTTSSKANNKEKEGMSRFPVTQPCRLRISLPSPNNESITEKFDSSEKLSTIYKWVKSLIPISPSSSAITSPRLVQLPGIYNAKGSQVIGVAGGAFANPHSLYGFTLMTAHPKREYSLEMHGSTTLKDLGLTPSAKLIVMMCSSRGQVKRGVLESKLAEAQGDAMDLDDLEFEALQELVEKVGVATPGDGSWKGIDETTLGQISKAVSPKEFLEQKSTGEEDSKCPICLGLFDPKESDPQLCTLNACHHTFHSSCLRTWFATKTNCPICNYSFTQG